MLVDTHAHLIALDDIPAVVERAKRAGVERIISISTTLDDARQTLELTSRYDSVFATVGLHPGEIPNVSLCDLKELAVLAGESKVVAIGETGLDYYRLPTTASGTLAPPPESGGATVPVAVVKQQQKDLFWAQLDLARQLGLPVVIHNRNADADCLQILRAHGHARGVMHCFGGDEKFAFECLELGLLISFTGILTFKNAGPLRAVAKKVPLEKVLLETDAPYLAPVPHRGKRNEPAFLPHIVAVLAEIKGVPVEEIARVTTESARQLFRRLS